MEDGDKGEEESPSRLELDLRGNGFDIRGEVRLTHTMYKN
jgi:hypothetical protein